MNDHSGEAVEVFEELGRRLADKQWDAAADLYAEDVEVSNPFAEGGPTTSRGRDAVRAFFAGMGGRLDSLTVVDATYTPGADPEVLTVEFAFDATAGGGSVQFQLPAVFVLRVRERQIISSHDYVGPRR